MLVRSEVEQLQPDVQSAKMILEAIDLSDFIVVYPEQPSLTTSKMTHRNHVVVGSLRDASRGEEEVDASLSGVVSTPATNASFGIVSDFVLTRTGLLIRVCSLGSFWLNRLHQTN